MRNLKRTILAAALLLSFSAAGAALGNDVSAASLQAAEPAGPVSNTGRDYRIALINAENSRGPVIHKPLKEEKENPVSRPGETNDANEGSAYRETSPSLRHHDKEESQNREEHRQHRFHKDGSDKGHRFVNTISAALTKTIMTGIIASMSTVSTALTKTIMTGTITSMSTASIALTKTKTPAGADPAAVTMTGAKENRPLCSRKMPDSDEAMIHSLHLIS